eukprot:TRINITY_DN1498_c0_g1_i1.p1 TRINITY_DN1498_c0_g1~~TRINITY_DN1498_c0_g1_i1.p1  ORF type:complete len:496 (-),score=136.82 TRINITY_DN1498_c0_g1_i1:125-1534(-)
MAKVLSQSVLNIAVGISSSNAKIPTKESFCGKENAKPVGVERKKRSVNLIRFSTDPILRVAEARKAAIQDSVKLVRTRGDRKRRVHNVSAKDNVIPSSASVASVELNDVAVDVGVSKAVDALESNSAVLQAQVDSQQFLLEQQAALFAVEKSQLEQQLQQALQSLEQTQCETAILSQALSQLEGSVASLSDDLAAATAAVSAHKQMASEERERSAALLEAQQLLAEQQASAFAAENHQLQELLHQALQCLKQAEGDALEEQTRCGEQQLEIASLSDVVSKLKAKNSELALTVHMREAVAEMTTNAFEGEKTRLHKQIAMLSNGAVKLCADLATATASLQKASEMRKRYAALMASEQLLLEKYAELQDVNASLVLQLQEAEANGSERVMSLQSNGSCEPHLLQHLVNTPEPQEQTTALIVPTSVTEQLALLFAPSTNSCFAADGTPWSLMPTSQTNSADSERMLREATEF